MNTGRELRVYLDQFSVVHLCEEVKIVKGMIKSFREDITSMYPTATYSDSLPRYLKTIKKTLSRKMKKVG